MTDFVAEWGHLFPRLNETNHTVSSGTATLNYNCVAFANHDTSQWWQPGRYWPSRGPAGSGNQFELLQLFVDQGWVECVDGSLEVGHEKAALYANASGTWTHAARLLTSGRWVSKMGELEVVEHSSPGDLTGDYYGEVFAYVKRPVAAS